MKRALFATATFALALLATAGAAHAQTQTDPTRAPHLVLDPRTLDFDGTTAGSKTFTITNKGNAELIVQKVVPAPDAYGFTVAGASQGTLAPGQSITVQVQYTPDGKRKQAFGGIQVWSSDASFPSPANDANAHVTGVSARAGNSWLLTAMIFIPLLGGLLIMFLPAAQEKMFKWVALATAAVPVVLSVILYLGFDRHFGIAQGNSGLQYIHHFVWIPGFNVEYFVGVDGISVTMMILTALVALVAVGASWNISKQVRGYFALFLLLETGMMGTFASIDFFLFYIFWELMLLPMYFLIGIWGGPRKEYAAIKFFLYTLAGSVLMLLAIIALYYNSNPTVLIDGTPAPHTFDIMKLAYANDFTRAAPLLGFEFVKVVWIGLFIGFAIKIPMFPFHTWLPDAHVEAPTAISVILAGVLLKMGTYGILRINFAILPTATQWAGFTMAVFGTINILYGAFCAFAQKDLKKLVAYSSVSHMGYCLVGMAAFTQTGFNGAMVQMFNHGTITSMLFILVGVIYDRAHTREIDKFGGMATQMPKYAAFFGFAFMASLGLPGLSGFIGEVLVFLGSFPVYRVITILAATGVIFTAAYHLWAMQRIQLGKWNDAVWHDKSHFPDLTMREALTLIPMAAIVLLLGFYPAPMLNLIGQGLQDLLQHVAAPGAGTIAGLP
jgi:NADH-quinone oxidoreductase subunit M